MSETKNTGTKLPLAEQYLKSSFKSVKKTGNNFEDYPNKKFLKNQKFSQNMKKIKNIVTKRIKLPLENKENIKKEKIPLIEDKILLNTLLAKIKFNVKYKLINFLYISKALFKTTKTNTLNIMNMFNNISKKKNINFYIYYKKLLFNLKYSFLFKNTIEKLDDKIILQASNLFLSNSQPNNSSNYKKTAIFSNKLNFYLIKNDINPNSYLNYDLNYYDFVSQTDINKNIKEQQFLSKKKKKLAKGTGFLFLPEKFLNKLSPQKKKLLTSYILQQQKRKKHEIYGYLSPLETKPLVTKGFIRPRKKMKKLGILYYRPTRRNLKMTFVDASGQVLAYYSCGTNKKFKKARRRLKDVRERTLFKMTVQIDDLKYKRVIIAFKGSQFVKVFKVLKRRRLKIIGYSFDTLIPHNGCRKPKKKRK